MERPHPPENCTILAHTKYYLQVRCQVADKLIMPSTTYLLQVYDANTRILLGTATSQNPEEITISELPCEHEDLLLFIRTMDAKSTTSDANIIYAPFVKQINPGGKISFRFSAILDESEYKIMYSLKGIVLIAFRSMVEI